MYYLHTCDLSVISYQLKMTTHALWFSLVQSNTSIIVGLVRRSHGPKENQTSHHRDHLTNRCSLEIIVPSEWLKKRPGKIALLLSFQISIHEHSTYNQWMSCSHLSVSDFKTKKGIKKGVLPRCSFLILKLNMGNKLFSFFNFKAEIKSN